MSRVCKECGIENDDKDAHCRSCGAGLDVAAPEAAAEGGAAEAEGAEESVWTRREAPAALAYAGFWKRALACVVDTCILFVIGIILGFGYLAISGTEEGLELASNIMGVLVGWLYHATLESSPRQASLGKSAVGIIVTDMDGKRISFYRATGRHFAKIVSAIIFGIGFIMAGFTEKKQALHDKMFDCLVVMKR